MALTDLLPDFGSVDSLDPLFQKLVARGVPRREAQQWILRALKSEGLIIMLRVASGARALYPRQFTPEEEAQAQEEYRTRAANFEFDALDEILHERSPPEGIIGPAYPEDWGRSLDLAIRDGHLVIEFLFPKFPPESYAFTIANPEAVDELLAAASPARASSAAVSPNPPVPEPPRPPLRAHEGACFAATSPLAEPSGWQAEVVLRWLRKNYPPAGKTPRSKTFKALRGDMSKDPAVITEIRKTGRAVPSDDVVGKAVKYLGRSD